MRIHRGRRDRNVEELEVVLQIRAEAVDVEIGHGVEEPVVLGRELEDGGGAGGLRHHVHVSAVEVEFSALPAAQMLEGDLPRLRLQEIVVVPGERGIAAGDGRVGVEHLPGAGGEDAKVLELHEVSGARVDQEAPPAIGDLGGHAQVPDQVVFFA